MSEKVAPRRLPLQGGAAELAEEYQPFIYHLALGFLRHPEDSEDATQDVLVRVVRFSPAFQNRSAPRTWLYRITYNVCMTRLRERRRAGLRLEPAAVAAAAEHSWEGANDRLVVREAVRRLPAKYRAPVALFFFAQLSHVQIAHRLGMPVNTVKIRIHRGKKLLRGSLGTPAGPAPDPPHEIRTPGYPLAGGAPRSRGDPGERR